MSAGEGTAAYAEALKLEELMVAVFGPDFREKVLVGPFGSFRLADSFDECGLVDPQRHPSSGAVGLWQMLPATHVLAGAERPEEQIAMMGRYVSERYPAWREEAERVATRWRRYASGSTLWPVSPAPRSPHGDPLR